MTGIKKSRKEIVFFTLIGFFFILDYKIFKFQIIQLLLIVLVDHFRAIFDFFHCPTKYLSRFYVISCALI
uniref:Uncharacterized protein n=1 Tax=Glossina brevipalpis TaxID=37001 RepID=A0A1A9X246_9MUSC